jgi:hypothetical protein
MSFVSFLHSIVKFASLIKASCIKAIVKSSQWKALFRATASGLPKNLTSCTKSVNKPSTSRQQVVFALLFPRCQQVWNKLLTICNNLVDIIRLVTRFFQQVRYCPIQSWYNSIVTTLCLQPCNILVYHDYINHVRTTVNNLVTSLIMPSSLLQVVNSLFQTRSNNWEQAVRRQLVDRLVTTCL